MDLSRLMPAGSAFNAKVLPNLAFAVEAMLNAAEAQWKRFAAGAPLPSGRSISNRSGEYLRSISQRHLGDFSGQVYSALPYAEAIERGSPARDMHEMLRSSLKVRVSARTGRRYLIIPFRHSPNASNVMKDNPIPPSVMDWWAKHKSASHVTGMGERAVHSDMRGTILPWHAVHSIKTKGHLMTPQRTYQWGDRLTRRELAGLGVSVAQSRRLAGMVNFRRPGKTGGAAHSQFITFRTMSEGSPGWRLKPREGYWPARTTAEQLQPVAEALFRRAIETDVRQLIP